MTDPILQNDLDAYVDNQLDASGRIRIERHLAADPLAAARVMSDLGIRGSLRLALELEAEGPKRPSTRDAARKLQAGLEQKQVWRNLQKIAAIGILVTAGWFANGLIGPFNATEVNASMHPPTFVEEAVRAHQTTKLREKMPSQPGVTRYDPEDIRSATGIVLPKLPDGWGVADVQIFPSSFGPSVELSIRADDAAPISLFAVRPGFFAVTDVAQLDQVNTTTAYWQIGDVAYSLVSGAPDSRLADEARSLAKTLY